VGEFLDSKNDHNKLRVFVNTVLGETWQERGEAPAIEKILLKREDWVQGDLPDDGAEKILLITLGADVQKDRIEVEIVGWGDGKESWSLDYLVLSGDTGDLRGTAWSALRDVLSCDFRGIGISMAFIDCGFRTSLVYAFCEDFSFGVMPCMGEESASFAKKIFSIRDVSGFSSKRVDLFTSVLKSEFYGYVQLVQSGDGEIPSGYCHFPASYDEKHFLQLLSEERVKQKTRSGAVRYVWKQKISRNEQLDCRIYAMGALYAFASYVSEDVSPGDPIPWASFWKMMKNEK
jgi:phage terminase large subunit GpA-like protein